jgi:hypothetical protein
MLLCWMAASSSIPQGNDWSFARGRRAAGDAFEDQNRASMAYLLAGALIPYFSMRM